MPRNAPTWIDDSRSRIARAVRLGPERDASRLRRFDAVGRLADFHQRGPLEIGCGSGGFLADLHARGVRPRYVGVDARPERVADCGRRFPESRAGGPIFSVGRVFEWEPAERPDYVVATDLPAVLGEDLAERAAPLLDRLLRWCRTGVAIVFPRPRWPRSLPAQPSLEPVETLRLALQLTPAIRHHHDYDPDEYALFAYRDEPTSTKRRPRSRRRLRP